MCQYRKEHFPIVSLPPIDPADGLVPRHVRVGSWKYQALEGAELKLKKSWRGRVSSMEVLAKDLSALLRSYGFRPFRPLEQGQDARNAIRLTGVREARVKFRFPWQPKMVSGLISMELSGIILVQKTLFSLSPHTQAMLYDVTATLSTGVAVFKNGRWVPMGRINFENLIGGAVEGILSGLGNLTASAGTSGLLFSRPRQYHPKAAASAEVSPTMGMGRGNAERTVEIELFENREWFAQ